MVNLFERSGGEKPQKESQLADILAALGANAKKVANQGPSNSNLNSRDYGSLLLNGQPGNIPNNPDPDDPSNLAATLMPSLGIQGPQDIMAIVRKLGGEAVTKEPRSSIDINGGLPIQTTQQQWQPMQLPTYDPDAYKSQAQSAVNAQYNPIIQELLSQQGAQKSRATTVKSQLGDVYGDLAKYMAAQEGVNYQGYEQAEKATAGAYTDQRDELAKLYADSTAQQQKEAQGLGIENLGVQENVAQQNTDKQFLDQMAGQQAQAEQSAFDLQQQSALNYDKAATGAARAEGVGRQQDIDAQLADFLQKSGLQVADTRAQAAGSVNDLMMQMANAAYGAQSDNAKFQYQQQRDQIGDANQLYQFDQQNQMNQLDMQLKQQQLQGGGQQDPNSLSPWQKVANFASQVQPQQAPDLIGALQQAMQSNPEIYAPDPNGARMNPSLFAKLVLDSPGGENVDQNSLAMVAQELYRLLYGTG